MSLKVLFSHSFFLRLDAKQLATAKPYPPLGTLYAMAWLRELGHEVQVLGIGDTRIVGLPAEIFAEFGLTIQYRAPFDRCFVIELANGCLPGYACTTQAYVQGGYETGTSLLSGKSGEQLVEAAVRLLKETKGT